MISRLTGTLIEVTDGKAEMACHPAITLEILLPAYLSAELAPVVGQEVTLRTRVLLESQGQGTSFIPRVLGFRAAQDLRFFELFTSVKGVGPKKALRALAEPPEVVASAIAARDTKALTKLPEIGKRLAETMVAELHGKVDPFVLPGAAGQIEAAPGAGAGPSNLSPVETDAVAALVALGESAPEAERRVTRAMAGLAAAGVGEPGVDEVVGAALG